MLQLQNIRKAYTTGDFTQVALDGVSVSFRDSEFVAVLGPSGSGKTTMLNIIGGLDHYDSGNLIIDGIPTDRYKDRDWDAYRNNRVGFVFQSYNLIPHQTVLANVELALTLSGVSREERVRRAKEALDQVGLAEHVNKKPSQLSGGQMQRVAIARALINDPEILLADEPTGALDSKTSVQIMDLLTQIAHDRLVVMVTHNPELAERYATRVVNLADGSIVSDSDPFHPTPEEMRLSEKPVRRTSMSFLTALSLSFNNLMTKKGRTIMTAFAGSIGIIGIAAILALANGVNAYIKSVEEDTLSVYPLQILSTGFDTASMMIGASGVVEDAGTVDEEAVEKGEVKEASILTRMFSSIGSNDLASLKSYLDGGESGVEQYVSSIEYSYNVTPQIYAADTSDGIRQVNPDTSFSALGMGSGASTNAIMSMSMSTDVFHEMVSNTAIVEEQYDVVAGHWPEKYNECIVVLTAGGSITDFSAYVLGLRDKDEMDEIVKQFLNEEEIVVPEGTHDYTYDELMGLELKLVNAADRYRYDADYDVWVDKSDDTAFMRELIENGEDLVIAGVVMPKPDVKTMSMPTGIYYTPALTQHLVEQAAESDIVKSQLDDSSTDVFSGKTFDALEDEAAESGFDMGSMFSIDTAALSAAFQIDRSKLTIDPSLFSGGMDPSGMPAPPAIDPSAFAVESQPSVNQAKLGEAVGAMMADYSTQVPLIVTQLMAEDADFNPVSPEGQQKILAAYFASESAQALMSQYMPQIVDTTEMQAELAGKIQMVMAQTMTTYMEQVVAAITAQTQASMTQAMSQLAANMAGAMSIDENAFMNAFQFNLDEDELTGVIMSMMRSDAASFDGNLVKLGYADLAKPSQIDIYPLDFESKQHVVDILDAYNDRMAEEDEDKQISYTDLVGTLMKSVTTIIDAISAVLIAFVAISLIVSSIMIGVITYISVLERRKEIGILRAIGASKGDISRVFNAETIIEGLVAGLLGVGVTAVMCVPASAIVYEVFDVPNVAQLPLEAGAVLVAISVFLTFIAGLIPASSASRKDPVEALRSE